MSSWMEGWAAHQERLKAGETERVLVEDDDEITLVEAVADDRDRGAWAFAKPTPRTLVVVPSLDHLPKPTLSQRDRKDSPRSEFLKIENVPLPLKRLEIDPIALMLDLKARYPWAEDAIDVLVGYLRRIIRNLAIDWVRRLAREGKLLAPAGIDEAIVEERPSPEAALAHRDELRIVLAAMAELPERTRAALEMHRFDGLKLKEIASRLGVSVALAHALVYEGLEHCRERLSRGT
ncbi:sigma-70 family RNA polymerase sigma factor [Bosea minatitlanensis]